MEPGVAGTGAGGREAASRPLTAEEEALKRNTDCVYFLASPLTCKKGNECEYRHSEGARVNPRDCWYWLNGNCLNPKCSFRHPPLDGLFGIPGTTSVPAPPSQTVATTQIPPQHAPAPYNLNKQSVPCYYFQKGQCLKGDRCSFMHVPQPTGAPVPQQIAKVSASVTEPPQTLKESWGPKEFTSQQNIPKASDEKPVELPPSSAKVVIKAESMPNNGLALKRTTSPYQLENELPRSQPNNVPVSSGVTVSMSRSHHSQPVDERLQNGRDADEFLGESSPGFDVLVDDDIEDSDYHHNEDDFGRESGQGGRSLYPATDFNYSHSDYEPVPSFERDQYNGMDEYDRYGRARSSYDQEQRRTSSERIIDKQLMPERRVLHREESPEKMDGSDLRHRLLKQRRLNGSRSTVSPDRRGGPYRRDDRYTEEERYRGRHSHKDQRHFPPEGSISTRLQGRITLPVRSSPDRPADLRSERERDRGRHRGRLSPARPTNYNEKHHDRMKRRPHEDFAADARNFRSQPIRRDDADPLNFAGPKSLAELKGAKVPESSQEQSTKSINTRLSPEQKSMKSGKAVDRQESEGSLSFEGPKPLSNILKRKRDTASENGSISSYENENNHRDGEEGVLDSSASAAVSDPQFISLSEALKEGKHTTRSMEESKVRAVDEDEEEEGLIPEAHEDDQSPAKDTVEMEEGMIVDTAEDRELENSDRRNEESDYEAVEGGDVKAEDDEHMYQGEEELDDDDEDDFARKVGVMFS